jgi:hypothetical protein
MSDATLVEAPRQRKTRAEHAKIKAGERLDGGDDPAQAARHRQNDIAARWTQQHDETDYGYNHHRHADAATQLLQHYVVTSANGHDRPVLDERLDTATRAAEERQRPGSAASAGRAAERDADVAKPGLASQRHEQGTRAAPWTADQKASNRNKSTVRARVAPICGAQAAMAGHVIRTFGLARAKVKSGRRNLTYHRQRRVPLTAIETRRLAGLAAGLGGLTAPGVA